MRRCKDCPVILHKRCRMGRPALRCPACQQRRIKAYHRKYEQTRRKGQKGRADARRMSDDLSAEEIEARLKAADAKRRKRWAA